MVTIKNDIESSSGQFIPTSAHPVKDVNLKRQEGEQPRRRSYRCVTIVSVAVLVLMGLGVGSVLHFGKALNRGPRPTTTTTTTTTTTSTTTPQPVEPSTSPPTFTDPYDDDGPETAVDPTDDDEFDIDGPEVAVVVSSTTDDHGTKVTTSWGRLFSSDEGSGSDDYYDEDASGDYGMVL